MYFAVLDFLRRMQQSERLLSIHETRIEQRTAHRKLGVQCQLVVTATPWPQGGAQDGMEGERNVS